MFESIQKHRSFYLFEAIAFIILGLLAIAIPVAFTFVTTIFIGWLLIVAGIWQLIRTFRTKHSWEFVWFLLSSLVTIGAGALIVLYPLNGALTLTALLIIYFLISGLSKSMLAFQMKPADGWGWLLVSGLISIAMALIIWQGWPLTGLWVIGLLVGIDLLFFGISLLMLVLNTPKTIS